MVWLLSEREDLQRFLEAFLGSNGLEVRPFADASLAIAALGRGELPDVVLADDPPPGLSRSTIEARLREMAPHIRCLFLKDSPDTKQPDEVRRFITDDFSLGASELLELIEKVLRESPGESTPPPSASLAGIAKSSLLRTITTFVDLIERYEFLNGGNGPMVQRYAVEVAKELGLTASRVEAIAAASLLYDIGMMRVRPEVKLKDAPLTPEDLEVIRQHPRYSAEFCDSLRLPWDVSRYVLHHHERYDGSGYPDGLAGRTIPIGARIIGVGDAYFAMIAKRPNREPRSEEEALKELHRQAGKQFDPEVIEVWTSLIQVRFLGEDPDGSRAKRIALIDDDHDLRVLLESRFAALNYEVVGIHEQGRVVSALIEAAPVAIILNADLPWVDAYQLLHRVRLEPRLGGVPFLFASARATGAAERARAAAAGADDYIVRPCPFQELIARVTSAIRKKERLTGQHFVRPLVPAIGIRGRLDDMGLAEICQVLSQGFKTAKVSISDAHGEGQLFFADGRLKHASYNGSEGSEAFFALLRVKEGEFAIEHGVAAPDQTVSEGLEHLLIEGMRLIDEEGRAGTP